MNSSWVRLVTLGADSPVTSMGLLATNPIGAITTADEKGDAHGRVGDLAWCQDW